MTKQSVRSTENTDRREAIAELCGVVREASESFGKTAGAHRLMSGSEYDPAPWRILGVKIGVAAFGLPETLGGFGGLPELVGVAEEVGRQLTPVPFLASVFAGQILTRSGAIATDSLRGIVAGEVVTVAALSSRGTWDPTDTPFEVDRNGNLTGSAGVVLHALDATWIIAAAGESLYLVDTREQECSISPVEALDPTRRLGRVSLSGAPALLLTTEATTTLTPAFDIAQLVLAAEQLGGAQARLDATVEYVINRRQFGRSIGSFQSIKHTLADLLVLIEMCRSALDRAIDIDENDAEELAKAASIARLWCADAYRSVTADTLQLHGGIGFTWEHDAHLYFRRARSDAALFGSSAYHSERLAKLLGWR